MPMVSVIMPVFNAGDGSELEQGVNFFIKFPVISNNITGL